jgi:hypothetical protein
MTVELSAPAVPSADAVATLLDLDPAGRTVRFGDGLHVVAQHEHAVQDLAVWLYMTMHAGNPGIFATGAILPDVEFEDEIHRSVPAATVAVPLDRGGAPVPALGSGGRELVELHRIRLLVDPARLATARDGRRAVRLPSRRPQLSPGFFMFVQDPGSWAPHSRVNRMYVRHEDPFDALADWQVCLEHLMAAGVVFRSKILSRREAYPRNDALVFYTSEDTDRVQEILTDARSARRPGRAGSPLCIPLGSGVTTAEDPRDPRPGIGPQSFGEHRCRVLAEAVVDTLASGRPLREALRAACGPANVDPENVARNVDARPGALGVP